MQEYNRMKIDYLRRSKERLRELESDIDCLIENVPSTEKAVTERRFRSEIEDLRKEVGELELMSLKCRCQIRIHGSGRLKLKIRSGSSRY